MPDVTEQWREILASDPYVDEIGEQLERLAAPPGPSGTTLSVAAESLFRALLLGAGEDQLEPLAALAARAPASSAREALGLAGCVTLLPATGRGDNPAPTLERWLDEAIAEQPELSDHERTAFALAAVALGFDDAAAAFAGRPEPFVPGASFGLDTHAFARYLVAADAASAAPEDVASAWTSFVAYFPIHLETEGLRWTDLLFAGYAVYVRIAGYEPGEVLDAIRDFVRDVAGT